MHSLGIITVCLLISLIFSELFRKFKLPDVIGQILAGILISLPVFGLLLIDTIFTQIEFLSELGIIFLLLLAGLEINLKRFQQLSKIEFIVAFTAAFIPFFLGFFGMKFLGFDAISSLVVGACLSISSEGTTLKVLMDLKRLNTKVGTIILGAGILDDVIGVLFLALILIIVEGENTGNVTSAILLPFMVISFVILCIILFKVLPKIIKNVEKEHSRIANFSMVLIIGLGIASLSQFFGLGHILGAFLAGMLINQVNKNNSVEKNIVEELKVMTFSFIIPFFFIYIGLHFDFMAIIKYPIQSIMILVLAFCGKFFGSILAGFFSKEISFKQSVLIGWGMNSRGAIELVIAEIARSNYLISQDIYSAIVFMAVVTTIIFPIALRNIIKKDPKIMDK
jgi:Kef-type K+ transport system membrane component KefB